MNNRVLYIVLTVLVLGTLFGCSSLTNREKGALVGAGLGAGTGALIGSAAGHAAIGAVIGGPVGLIAGALIGDHITGGNRRIEQKRQIDVNQAEVDRLKKENERLRQQRGEW